MVAHRASFRCERCNTYLGMAGDVDHVVPRGVCEDVGIGVYDPSNLQYLCPSCHSAKTNAERWAGHTKRGPQQPQRTKVQGRDQFLNAAGISPTNEPQEELPC
ncbi:HNH endonuclease [Jannaschia sp. 2305UL9-9]|uniref:HNH endonuclease n=1 Tax=Jannaschia sp. 2305UL9-9 TaxID=3121638 RepID=UPI0035293217